MKLLIAEDDVFFVNILEQVLGTDHQLFVARDGNEAWAALQQRNAPRMAILDWVMPGLSGPEICRRVRASATLSSMYLIIFTAKNNTADIVSGLRAGADDYIAKPPVAEELRARVALGERLLTLQNAVTSVPLYHVAEREHRLRGLGALQMRSPLHDNMREVDAYFKRHGEPAERRSNSGAKAGSPTYRLTPRALENSHS
jgi:DNA-binding response OmpR family regulator